MATVREIVNRTSLQLVDPAQAEWRFEEIVDWINEAVASIYSAAPALSMRTTQLTVTPGRNELPVQYTSLVTVDAIKTPTGVKHGLRLLDWGTLDAFDPNWRSVTGEPTGYLVREQDPRAFWLYPQPPASTVADVTAIAEPAKVVDPADVLPVPEQYVPAVTDFVLSRAYLKNGDVAGAAERAQVHMNNFMARLS